jgi:hypothetical protein
MWAFWRKRNKASISHIYILETCSSVTCSCAPNLQQKQHSCSYWRCSLQKFNPWTHYDGGVAGRSAIQALCCVENRNEDPGRQSAVKNWQLNLFKNCLSLYIWNNVKILSATSARHRKGANVKHFLRPLHAIEKERVETVILVSCKTLRTFLSQRECTHQQPFSRWETWLWASHESGGRLVNAVVQVLSYSDWVDYGDISVPIFTVNKWKYDLCM